MIKYIYTICCILGLLTSCDLIESSLPEQLQIQQPQDSVQITVLKTEVMDHYRRLRVGIDLRARSYNLNLADKKNIKTSVSEVMYPLKDVAPFTEPKLDSIVNVASEKLQEMGLGVLVMVDLTKNKEVIDMQRLYINRMKTQYASHNLFISFMLPGGDLTGIIEATPYVINTYISENSPYLENTKKIAELTSEDEEESILKKNSPYLLRSLQTNLIKILSKSEADLYNIRKLAFIVMTDGVVYDDMTNTPIDPDHFNIQQELLELSKKFTNNLRIYFVSLQQDSADEEEEEIGIDNNQLYLLATRSKGAVVNNMDWWGLSDDICKSFGFQLTDYELYFSQPNNKILRGNKRSIRLSMLSVKDSLQMSVDIPYQTGTIYDPILLGQSSSYYMIVLRSIIIGLIILLLTYLMMQFVVPYGLYVWFKKNFVVHYSGINMSFRGMSVSDTCYYCKAPFVVGDKIVTKCKHVMHEDCWNENEGQCTEYGKKCPDGRHFYDKQNLFNPRNASYYMKWVLTAIVAAIIAVSIMFHKSHNGWYHLLDSILNYICLGDIELNNLSLSDLGYMSARLYYMMTISIDVTVPLTFLLSLLVVHNHRWQRKLAECLGRALAVGFIAWLLFVIECLVVVSTKLYDGKYILDWIPWVLISIAVAGSLVIRTRIKPRREYLLYAAGIGAVASLGWSFVAEFPSMDYVILNVLVCTLYTVGIAVLMGQQMPRHEHNMLHVSGPIKDMDIALYKWLNGIANARVTIGKSVDCNISITWDLQSNISPLAVELVNNDNRVQIIAMDEGIELEGSRIPVNKPRTLYHGDKFRIGQTEFKFIEE